MLKNIIPEEFEEVLEKVINDNNMHARWINLLSYLEFIGSGKIFKTQKPGVVNESLLKHAADEARHALYLKQIIPKLIQNQEYDQYDSETMIAPFSGFRYIQSLDAMVKRKLMKDGKRGNELSHLCYVYMSYVIEVRANWLYDIYERLLKKNNSPVSISMIISDEIRHLKEMKSEIINMDNSAQENIDYFVEKEKSYFLRFYKGVISKLN